MEGLKKNSNNIAVINFMTCADVASQQKDIEPTNEV